VGETQNGQTTFGSSILLKAGVDNYHDLNEILAQLLGDPETPSRWGDYSSMSVDPADPTHFWTLQMYCSGTGETLDEGIWSTQVTEIITTQTTTPPLLTIVPQGTNVLVSWPLSASSFHLTATTNLLAANSWASVPQTTTTNGLQISVLLPQNTEKQFFRLQSP
jgi:hypothetical protein